MKTYDETIESIFSKGDALIEKKRIQIKKIERTSATVSGICAAAIVSVGVWRITSSNNLNNNNYNENYILDDVENNFESTEKVTNMITTKSISSFSSTTSNKTITTKAIDSVSTTCYSGVMTTEMRSQTIPASNTILTTAKPDNVKQISTIPQITQPHTTTVALTTQIENPTTIPENPYNHESSLQNKFIEIKIKKGMESAIGEDNYKTYSYTNVLVEDDLIENIFDKQHIQTEYYADNELKTIETDIEMYSIKDISSKSAVAVNFLDDDKYYFYFDKSYYPNTLSKLIEDLALSSDGINDTAYVNLDNKECKGFDINKVWNMITENIDLPNKSKYCSKNGIVIVPKISFYYTSPYINAISGSFGISENGYISTNIGRIGSCYYIGEDKANEIINYIIENY
ncbi:hypothetical protein [Ruminococcus sp.]|uniref:hypothetical protein n=1 Tax=Ruminococcus sp. TaxID=41978 RepID=UPI0025D89AC4|nr:hypothetical protein [Ruminococcus sp.]